MNATIESTHGYPFSEADAQQAHDEWGCNCGPAALAFAIHKPLNFIRDKIPGFEQKRYTSPSMMAAALVNVRVPYVACHVTATASREEMFSDAIALVRIQWTGPWTAAGANQKWAYRQTHWIATWLDVTRRNESDRARLVFDCNGGIRSFRCWQSEIVPALTAMYKRADGGWFPTHIWRIERCK